MLENPPSLDALAHTEVDAFPAKLLVRKQTSVDGTRKFLLDESAKWAKYIKAANIEPQ